jgi:AAA ATPase domain
MEERFPGPGLTTLRGRATECALLDGAIAAIRKGESQTLVLRGEAGVGKTALLEYLVDSAPDLQVARAVGVESEMELALASLHQLFVPMLDRVDRLPAPQREALAIVFGLTDGAPPDLFLVGLAVLSLLSETAEDRPLLCVVDDAQWLDRASARTLAFAARRLQAEPVGLLFAAPEPGEELRGLPEPEVTGLRTADARALLSSTMRFLLDERIRDRIVAETRGNPLALLELPRGLTATQLAGGFGLLGVRALSGRIEESFERTLKALPDDTRRLMLVAAAEPVGDPLLLWQAGERLGLGAGPLAAAETDGLRQTRLRPELGRAHLLYGEWLRRENRRSDARVQLRAAYELLSAIGMAAFAERSRVELHATGESVHKRTVATPDDLTPQERQIAHLARDGHSNAEIGARSEILVQAVCPVDIGHRQRHDLELQVDGRRPGRLRRGSRARAGAAHAWPPAVDWYWRQHLVPADPSRPLRPWSVTRVRTSGNPGATGAVRLQSGAVSACHPSPARGGNRGDH